MSENGNGKRNWSKLRRQPTREGATGINAIEAAKVAGKEIPHFAIILS